MHSSASRRGLFGFGEKIQYIEARILRQIIAKKAETLLETDTTNWADFDIKRKPQQNDYAHTCLLVKANRKSLASKEASEIGQQFEQCLINEIIPYWYGTTWSFDGHTDKPGQGEIACGYFVSTTLQHVGVNVNRYQLAQQTPENEAKSLAIEGEVIEVSDANSADKIKNCRWDLLRGLGKEPCRVFAEKKK